MPARSKIYCDEVPDGNAPKSAPGASGFDLRSVAPLRFRFRLAMLFGRNSSLRSLPPATAHLDRYRTVHHHRLRLGRQLIIRVCPQNIENTARRHNSIESLSIMKVLCLPGFLRLRPEGRMYTSLNQISNTKSGAYWRWMRSNHFALHSTSTMGEEPPESQSYIIPFDYLLPPITDDEALRFSKNRSSHQRRGRISDVGCLTGSKTPRDEWISSLLARDQPK